ncbi:MAG: hypothetical protein IT316_12890 [Anaerolineales bacterium]|nr:hypothetical protein [Anaerolineales bacterium]
MFKVHILTTCDHCKGEAYLPVGEAVDAHGQPYVRHLPCPACDGTGQRPRWVDIQKLARMLAQAQCPHAHSSLTGRMHFSAGEVWDNIREVCTDCGADLDAIQDEY